MTLIPAKAGIHLEAAWMTAGPIPDNGVAASGMRIFDYLPKWL